MASRYSEIEPVRESGTLSSPSRATTEGEDHSR